MKKISALFFAIATIILLQGAPQKSFVDELKQSEFEGYLERATKEKKSELSESLKAKILKALGLMWEEKYGEAKLKWDEVIAEATKEKVAMADFYYSRGECLERSGDTEAAIKDFSKVINLAKEGDECAPLKLGMAYGVIGITKKQAKQYDEGIECFTQAIANLSKTEMKEALGNVYAERLYCFFALENGTVIKNQIAAQADADKAVELLIPFKSEILTTIYYQRATLKFNKKEYVSAIEDCNAGLAINSKDMFLYASRGFAKWSLGDLDGAIADFRISGDLGYAQAFETIGIIEKEKAEKMRPIVIQNTSPSAISTPDNSNVEWELRGIRRALEWNNLTR